MSDGKDLAEFLKQVKEKGNIFNLPSVFGNYPELQNAVRIRSDQRLTVTIRSPRAGTTFRGVAAGALAYRISGLFISIDGQVIAIDDWFADATETVTREYAFGDGFLVSLNVTGQSGTVPHGWMYGVIFIRPSSSPAYLRIQKILAQGYFSDYSLLTFPQTHDPSAMEDRNVTYEQTDPIPGGEFSTGLLTGQGFVFGTHNVLSVRFTFTASAAVATRRVGVWMRTYDNAGPGLQYFRSGVMASDTHTAGQTFQYIFQQGGPNGVTYNTEVGFGFQPSRIYQLPSPFKFVYGNWAYDDLVIGAENIQGADQISSIYINLDRSIQGVF